MPSPKDGTNDQWGLASSSGSRASIALPLGNGDGAAPLVDLEGRVWVRPTGEGPPDPSIAGEFQERSSALLNDAEIRGSGAPLLLLMVSGFVQAASDAEVNYVQLYDQIGAPAGSPVFSCRVVGPQNYAWSPPRGWRFATGIRWAISTSPTSYVAGAVGWYNAIGWETLP